MTARIANYRNPPVPLERLSENLPSLRRHALIGAGVMAVLVLGLGGWTATTQIAGAVIANGVVVVDGGSRHVQHQEGGIVKQILVKNDDKVAAGQLLVRLDDVAVRSDLDVVMAQLREAIGNQARLTAESIGASAMTLPQIVDNWPTDPELAAVMGEQEKLRQSRKKSLDAQASRLDEQIAAKQSQITGLKAQQDANNRQLALYQTENANLAKLFADGLVAIQRVNDMKRSQADLEGQIGSVAAAIASTQSSIGELQMQRGQLYIDFRSSVMTDLAAASRSVAELLQKKIAAQDRLTRLEIRAPIAGTVHESIVQTVGGVISPADTLMMIVPQDNHLLVDTRVSPLDIDKLHVGQPVDVRLSSLDVRTAPDLQGTVLQIAPDLTRDATTGAQYYPVRLDISDAEQKKLPAGTKLVPGMPAEAFIQTGNRTVWAYLVRPITEGLSYAFREK